MDGEQFRNAKQIAQLIGKSTDWVRRRAADGTMPHHYVGRDLRFLESEVRDWVMKQTPRPPPPVNHSQPSTGGRPVKSGIEEMRALVHMANKTRESALDGHSLEEVVRLLRACRALDLDVLPDQLTPEEREDTVMRGHISTPALRRLYRLEGLPETGIDWEGR